ncbi:hypothetical protein [Amycolatopsis sp. NBC_01286]|uniref:hypothetical protein n=1 Tax=Amycolatopsis sp. NBC_01286 TaxID=2903560 RepID=UPI002E0F2585|nr:hypothetical protein OG570_21565 [Amycolatopsis sp. NBC_01286]
MMDTSLTDTTPAPHPFVLRMLILAGALFGFTVLALLVSGTANAAEGSPPPDRPGLLDQAGQTVHGVLEPVEPALKPVTGTLHAVTTQVEPVLKPVTGTVHTVTSQVAPVLKPVTDTVYAVTSQVAPVLEPVTSGLEPVVAPLIHAVKPVTSPVLSALRPVTQPVLHALSPATEPVLQSLSPVTEPVLHVTAPVTASPVRPIRTDQVVPAVTGQPAVPQPREGASASPVQARVFAVVHSGSSQAVAKTADTAVPMSGSGGGGLPADVSGTSGAMSASPGGQHGGEYAVTSAGSRVLGTDRAWRAPPGAAWSLYWLVFYGNDHPS